MNLSVKATTEPKGESTRLLIDPGADWQTVIMPRLVRKAGSPEATQQPAQCTACQHCGDVCSGTWAPRPRRRAARPPLTACVRSSLAQIPTA